MFAGDLLRDLQGRVEHHPVGDDRQIRPLPVDPGLVQRNGEIFFGDVLFYEAVGLLVLEEEDGVRIADRALQHPLSVRRKSRGDDFETGSVTEARFDALGVVEGPTGDRAVGSPDRHGTVPGAVGAVVEAGGLVDYLVEGRVDEVGELYLGNRTHPVYGEAYRGADYKALRQRRVHRA